LSAECSTFRLIAAVGCPAEHAFTSGHVADACPMWLIGSELCG